MKLYDLNKSAYASIPNLTSEEKKAAIKLISNYIRKNYEHYYMVLNHDVHYYTMYVWEGGEVENFANDVYNLLAERGAIKSVELSQNEDMVEIWVYNALTNECNMYGFFGYDQGVIEL